MNTPYFFPQVDGKTVWRVSSKWLTRRHECNFAGISTRCGGMCCSTAAFWPPKAFADPTLPDHGQVSENGVGVRIAGVSCGMLTPAGCSYSPEDRPITCLLYPLILNKQGTLVLHNRTTTGKGICKGNHNNGPIIIDVVRDNLIALFGEEQVSRVRETIIGGRDSYFLVSADILRQYFQEKEWEAKNMKPIARREVV